MVLLPLSPEPVSLYHQHQHTHTYLSPTRARQPVVRGLSDLKARSCIPAAASSSPPRASGRSSDSASSGPRPHCCRCSGMLPSCDHHAAADGDGATSSTREGGQTGGAFVCRVDPPARERASASLALCGRAVPLLIVTRGGGRRVGGEWDAMRGVARNATVGARRGRWAAVGCAFVRCVRVREARCSGRLYSRVARVSRV